MIVLKKTDSKHCTRVYEDIIKNRIHKYKVGNNLSSLPKINNYFPNSRVFYLFSVVYFY